MAACQRPGKRDHCEDVFFYLKKKQKMIEAQSKDQYCSEKDI